MCMMEGEDIEELTKLFFKASHKKYPCYDGATDASAARDLDPYIITAANLRLTNSRNKSNNNYKGQNPKLAIT